MAANLSLTLYPGTPHRIDGLCPSCALPALIELTVYLFKADGPHPVGMFRGCADCKQPCSPLN